DRFLALLRKIVAEPDARFRAGNEGRLRAALIHGLQRLLRRIVDEPLPSLPLHLDDLLDPARRTEVVVQIEPARVIILRKKNFARNRRSGSRTAQAVKKLAA